MTLRLWTLLKIVFKYLTKQHLGVTQCSNHVINMPSLEFPLPTISPNLKWQDSASLLCVADALEHNLLLPGVTFPTRHIVTAMPVTNTAEENIARVNWIKTPTLEGSSSQK